MSSLHLSWKSDYLEMLQNKLKQTTMFKTFYNNFFSVLDKEPRALNVVGSRCDTGHVLFIQQRSVPGFPRSRLEHWQERGEKVDPDLRRLNCNSLKSDFFFLKSLLNLL